MMLQPFLMARQTRLRLLLSMVVVVLDEESFVEDLFVDRLQGLARRTRAQMFSCLPATNVE
jgi:hypothetical protein